MRTLFDVRFQWLRTTGLLLCGLAALFAMDARAVDFRPGDIAVIAPSGAITVVDPGTGAVSEPLFIPTGMKLVWSQGTLYGAEATYGLGAIDLVEGEHLNTRPISRLGLVADDLGQLYSVTFDWENDASLLQRFHPESGVGPVLTQEGRLPDSSGAFPNQAMPLVRAADGTLYMIPRNGELLKVDPATGTQTLLPFEPRANDMAILPDGRLVLFREPSSIPSLLDPATGAEIFLPPLEECQEYGCYFHLGVDYAGRVLVSTSNGESGRLSRLDPAEGVWEMLAQTPVTGPGVWGDPVVVPPTPCRNGLDDDGDGDVDFPEDDGCLSAFGPSEAPACSNGEDDDGDGATDFPADSGCAGPWEASEVPACANGLDDDGDGAIDAEDPGCSEPGAPSEEVAPRPGDVLFHLDQRVYHLAGDSGWTTEIDPEAFPGTLWDVAWGPDGTAFSLGGSGSVAVRHGGALALPSSLYTRLDRARHLLVADSGDLVLLTEPDEDGRTDVHRVTPPEETPSLVAAALPGDPETAVVAGVVLLMVDPAERELVVLHLETGALDRVPLPSGAPLPDRMAVGPGLRLHLVSAECGCAGRLEPGTAGFTPLVSGDFRDVGVDPSGRLVLVEAERIVRFDPRTGLTEALAELGELVRDVAVRSTVPECRNGLDDDLDGLVDHPADPGCGSPAQDREDPACDDARDNDGDGLVDHDGAYWGGPPDPECVGVPFRPRETPGGCGAGLELGLALVPPAAWAHRRARRRTAPRVGTPGR